MLSIIPLVQAGTGMVMMEALLLLVVIMMMVPVLILLVLLQLVPLAVLMAVAAATGMVAATTPTAAQEEEVAAVVIATWMSMPTLTSSLMTMCMPIPTLRLTPIMPGLQGSRLCQITRPSVDRCGNLEDD